MFGGNTDKILCLLLTWSMASIQLKTEGISKTYICHFCKKILKICNSQILFLLNLCKDLSCDFFNKYIIHAITFEQRVKITMNLVFQEASTISYTVWLKQTATERCLLNLKGVESQTVSKTSLLLKIFLQRKKSSKY